MFESAEIGHKVSWPDYLEKLPGLRVSLLNAQYALLAKSDFPVVVLIGGVDGAGKGETVNLLNAWLDPRYVVTHAFAPPTPDELERPRMWRYWQALPPKGHIGILFGSWYTEPLVNRLLNRESEAVFYRDLQQIERFETMLAAEGVLFVKLWFHLSKRVQRAQLKTLEANPLTRWRVTERDRQHLKTYDRFRGIAEEALRETSTGDAPWHIIDSADLCYRGLTAGKLLVDALETRLRSAPQSRPMLSEVSEPLIDGRNLFNALDYTQKPDGKSADKKAEELTRQLSLQIRSAAFLRRSLVIVFEGLDAAGKGSTIRHVTGAIDARHFTVFPIAAPTEEERRQPYLWRFWRRLPRNGQVALFDRSWYGRVLVERVEGICDVHTWQRAYHEINEFEAQLVAGGTMVIKFWLAITKEEQLKRFHDRENTPYKTFKLTQEDWRSREKWPLYEQAACDMVEHTSTSNAPWHIIPANNKHFARAAVLEILCRQLEAVLRYPENKD